MKFSLVLVADRGILKAYRREETPSGCAFYLIDSLRVTDARGRYEDKFTDQAGSFPAGGTGGAGNAIAERMTQTAESEMRCFRKIAGFIVELLERHEPEGWAFAAPSEINGAILDGIPSKLKEGLRLNVPRDLVNVPPDKLSAHFSPPSK